MNGRHHKTRPLVGQLRRNAGALLIVICIWLPPAVAITMGWLRVPLGH